jgi:hypothetical protein
MGKKLTTYDDVYLCDPTLQPDCNGKNNPEWCGKKCFMTKDICKAVHDEHGVHKLTLKQYMKEYKKRNPEEK